MSSRRRFFVALQQVVLNVGAQAVASLFVLVSLLSGGGVALSQSSNVASPSPSSLPLIGRTHSNLFCSTLRESITPVVLGIMNNDRLIGRTRDVFSKMLHDRTMSTDPDAEFSGQADRDRNYLGSVAGSFARNLRTIKTILEDDKAFPSSTDADDNASIAKVRAQLRALADKQNAALNIINGTVETEMYEEMVAQRDTNMSASVGSGAASTSGASVPSGSNGRGGNSLSGPPLSVFDPKNLYDSNILGHRRYDHVLAAIADDQTAINALETALTPGVIAGAQECGSSSPIAHPTASP